MADDRPRVCIVSEDLSLPTDEGLKKFVYSVSGPLREPVDLCVLSTAPEGRLGRGVREARANRMMVGSRLTTALRAFRPDAIIYIPRSSGTRNAFLRCALLRHYAPQARMVMISLQPRHYGKMTQALVRMIRPDRVAVQSFAIRDQLLAMGIPSTAIPSGVDVAEFSPTTSSQRELLRRRYGIDREAFVVLHVGHFQKDRNVMILDRLRRNLECQALMVGSTWMQGAAGVKADLIRAGVKVIDSYVDNIAEIYRLADCYVFPVHTSSAAIEMPLSVLEAMACGLPVASTRFGSLEGWLAAGVGLTYCRTDDELLDAVRNIRKNPTDQARVRSRILKFSWPSIANRILDLLELDRGQRTEHMVATQRTGLEMRAPQAASEALSTRCW